MEKLFLIDAYAQIFRAYYAFAGRPMRNRQGVNTSPIFGFTKFLRDIIIHNLLEDQRDGHGKCGCTEHQYNNKNHTA